jgi:hypothetical protein
VSFVDTCDSSELNFLFAVVMLSSASTRDSSQKFCFLLVVLHLKLPYIPATMTIIRAYHCRREEMLSQRLFFMLMQWFQEDWGADAFEDVMESPEARLMGVVPSPSANANDPRPQALELTERIAALVCVTSF